MVGIGTDNDNSIHNDSDDEIFDEEAVPLRKRRRLNHNKSQSQPSYTTHNNDNTNDNGNTMDNSNDNKSSNKNNNSFSTINGHLSVFKPKKNRISKIPIDPKLRGEYYVNQCKKSRFGGYMNLEHLSIDEDGYGQCAQCIFNEVKCVYAYENPPSVLAKGCKIKSVWCIEYHFLGEKHNPAIKMYKVMFHCVL